MTLPDFTLHQREDTMRVLSSLVETCLRRYVRSAELVGVEHPGIQAMREATWNGQYDISALLPAWDVVCDRYRKERFDPQQSFFADHEADALQKWGRFLYWHLFPHLCEDNKFIRNVLRSVGMLPCRDKDKAVAAYYIHIAEFALPLGGPLRDGSETP